MQPGAESRWNAPFVGIPSFLRSLIATDLDRLDADIAVMGVPSDEGSPFMPGSRFGPRGIREHSMRFGGRGHGYYDPSLRREFLGHEVANHRIVDVGDADVLPTNVAGTFDNVTEMVRAGSSRAAPCRLSWGAITASRTRSCGRTPSRSTWSTSTPTSTTSRSSTGSS